MISKDYTRDVILINRISNKTGHVVQEETLINPRAEVIYIHHDIEQKFKLIAKNYGLSKNSSSDKIILYLI